MATINVTTTVDENNGTGEVSLREAIIQANSKLGDDNIILMAGQTYTLTLAGTNEDAAATGDLDIVAGGKTTISTSGDGKATVDAGGIDRVFHLTTQLASLTLKNIVVTGGKTDSSINGPFISGGGIDNIGNLELESSIVSGNASDHGGGGIDSSGNLNIFNSTISENSARYGGGIRNNIGNLTVTNSTISGNLASTNGGGIHNRYGSLTVTNSTISSNLASINGGGINNAGTGTGSENVTVTNSTITNNLASNLGGGIYNSGNLNLGNSIVAKNTSADSFDISVRSSFQLSTTSQGNNLIGSGSSNFISTTTDKIGVDPLLGDLQNNGGPTATYALLGGSPAIDAGSSTLTKDQRGFTRNGVADIGAFEFDGINDPTPPTATSFTPADAYFSR